MTDTVQQAASAALGNLTAQPGGFTVTPPVDAGNAWQLYQEKQKREAEVAKQDSITFSKDGVRLGGYVGAMFRQDSPVDGLMAHAVGAQMAPDANYSPHQPDEWKRLTTGIPEDFHKEFYGATSQAQAEFTRGRLMQKVGDLQSLGDLSKLGTAGRMLFGLVEPVAALAGMATFQTTRVLKATTGASGSLNAARAAKDFSGVEAGTKALALAAGAEGGKLAIAGGLGVGGGLNAGLEKLRQSVNFENDSSQVLEAALVGTVMSAPFVYLGSREMTRLSQTANLEHQVLGIMRKNHEGTPLNEADHALVRDLGFELKNVHDVETGVHNPNDLPQHPAYVTNSDELAAWSALDKANEPVAPTAMEVAMARAEASKAEAAVKQAELKRSSEIDAAFSKRDSDTELAQLMAVAKEHADKAKSIELAYAARELELSGFKGGSIGSGQGQALGIDETAFSKGRLDIYAVLNRQPNLVIQELAHDFVKDAIGNSKFYAQGRTASEIKSSIKRIEGGAFHVASREAFAEAVKLRQLGIMDTMKFSGEFHENVTRLVRGDHQVLIDNADISGPLGKAETAMKEVYRNLAERAQKSGLEGAEGIQPNDFYANRVWSHNNIRETLAKLDAIYGPKNGRAELDRMVAAAAPAFRNNIEKAHTFIDAVRKLEFQSALQDIQLMAKDMAALRKELAAHNLNDAEVNSIVDMMFASKKTEADAGNPTNLRFRLDLDESFRETLPDGSEFRIADLFENDSRLLVDKYINSMGGHIGMAEKGYRSRAAVMAKLTEADNFHAENLADKHDGNLHKRSRQLIADMYDHITGRPMSMQNFNRGDRFLGAFRAYARSTFLGELGIAAAFEMKNAIGIAGVRAFYQQMPGFAGIIDALRSGRLANKALASDIEHMAGFGMEKAAGYARAHEVTDFTGDVALTRMENYANKASHAVDIISGNSHFTSATRQYAAALFIQKHYNLATGKTKITDSIRERLVHQGINADELDDVLAHLKDHTTVDRGIVKQIDWETWQQKHPETYDSYTLAVERDVRDAIQDHDIGETMPFMHHTMGKVWGELKTFSLVGHAKQFLKGAHYRDQTAARTWTIALMGEALSYSIQTSINFAHNPAELERRLTLERIGKAAVARMSVLGIAPMLLESGYYVGSGGGSLLQNGSTTNTDNRNALLSPSMMALAKLGRAASTVVGAANPMTQNITTNQDMRDLMGTLPGGNAWVMRNINDYISSGFPKHEARISK